MSFRFDPQTSLIVVPTRIVGPAAELRVHLGLDTGASVTMINADVLNTLGYDPASTTDRIRVTMGSTVEFVSRVVIESVEALGVLRNDHHVICHTLPPSSSVDGLLGLSFFRDRRLTIDFRKGTVVVV